MVTIRSGETRLEVNPGRLVAIPGGRASLDVVVTNRSEAPADYDLSAGGVPAHWGGAPIPIMGVKPGEQRAVRLVIRVPAFPEGQPAHHELVISATRRGEPPFTVETALPLIVASFELEGRVGVLMESTHFAAQPGDPLTIPLTVSNHGLMADTLEATLEGLPAEWITSPAAQAPVPPGEQANLAFTIAPPRGPEAQAGQRPFVVRVRSRESPDQAATVECTLDLPEIHAFGVQVLPNQTPAGQAAAVKIQNWGNAPTEYTVSWESGDQRVDFTPSGPAVLTVAPGSTERVAYLPRLRRRPLVGGTARYPYTVRVDTAETTHIATAEVVTRGLLPGWLGTAALFAGIIALALYLVVQWAVAQPPILTPTPDLTLTPPATPTIPPGLTPVG